MFPPVVPAPAGQSPGPHMPVSDRMWVLTATGATPAPALRELLNHLADGDSRDTAIGAPVDEKTVTATTQPLSDAGWKHTVGGRWIRWTSPIGDADVQFDAFTTQHPSRTWPPGPSGSVPNPDRPTWTLTAPPHTPRVRSWPTSPRPSPTKPALATHRPRAPNAERASSPPRQPLRRSRPAPLPAVHA